MELTFDRENQGFLSVQEKHNFYQKMKQIVVIVESTWNGGEVTLTGGGFTLKPRGHIMTCAHLVKGNEKCRFRRVEDSRFWKTEIVFVDKARDIAIIRVCDEDMGLISNWKYGQFANQIDIAPGDGVVTISHPDKLYYSMACGYVSWVGSVDSDMVKAIVGKHRDTPEKFEGFLMGDIHGSCGSQGALVFNHTGHIIGMCSSVAKDVDFAIPYFTLRDCITNGNFEEGNDGECSRM